MGLFWLVMGHVFHMISYVDCDVDCDMDSYMPGGGGKLTTHIEANRWCKIYSLYVVCINIYIYLIYSIIIYNYIYIISLYLYHCLQNKHPIVPIVHQAFARGERPDFPSASERFDLATEDSLWVLRRVERSEVLSPIFLRRYKEHLDESVSEGWVC